MEITFYTKETVPHRPMYPPQGTERSGELELWAAHAADPTQPHHGLCGACDWAYLRGDKKYKQQRLKMEAEIHQFQRKGKLPALRAGIKFGGCFMSDKEASRVVLPRIPLSPAAGSDSFLKPEDLIIPDVLERYLTLINRAGPKTFVREEEGSRQDYRYSAGAKHETRRWKCGCTMTRDKYQSQDWTTWAQGEVCAKHKGAINGRDERTGEILG